MPSIGAKQRQQKREKEIAGRTKEQQEAADEEVKRKQGAGVACVHCGRKFPSRNKMFKHLQHGKDGGEACMAKAREDGMPAVKETERCALLLGYAGDPYAGLGAEYQGHMWQADGIHGEAERLLWEAVHAADGREGAAGKVQRFSRASRADRGLHSVGNVVCLTANKLRSQDPAESRAWCATVNAALPEDIRVIGRWSVEGDFHAKNSVEKRRYEMLVPLHTLVDSDVASAAQTAQRSAQAQWRWEHAVATTDPAGWTLEQPSEAGGVTQSCTSSGMALRLPGGAVAFAHRALRCGPVALSEHVYAEWWQQNVSGGGLSPSVQVAIGFASDGAFSGVKWFVSAEQFETVSALDTLGQRELKICQPLASRMGWLPFDRATCAVVTGAEVQRLPEEGLVAHMGWLVTGDAAAATAVRFSATRLAECGLPGPFMWHADATTTDRIGADAAAPSSAASPELKRMRTDEAQPGAAAAEQPSDSAGGSRSWDLYRLRLLARLKSLIRRFEGDELHACHNFSEGVSSTEARAKKRVSRCHCRGIIQLGPSLECVVLTFQSLEDGFLYNQLRKIVGLLVAVARGDVPEHFINLALSENAVLPVPCAPAHLGAIVDCIYTRKIVRANWNEAGEIKQPTGERDGAVSFNTYRLEEVTAWKAKMHAHMAKLESEGGGRYDAWVRDVLYDDSSVTSVTRMTRELAFYSRGKNDLDKTPISMDVPGAFRHLLCLLREAELSGRWPASSISRRNVIDKASKRGESFALGRMPAHLKQPLANERFPELLQAAIALEHVLMPDRPASSTIVVNKHAQFKPHKDSGAGAGQHVSMIAGLGEYSGGELVVEGSVNDIRYKALEFDGWQQRHWTLPFDGERFSIVWFTPMGCEEVAPSPTEVSEAVAACAAAQEVRAAAGGMVPRVVPVDEVSISPDLEHPEWAVELKNQQPSGGHKILMPLVGIGTFRLKGLDTGKVVGAALSAGCRLIDTAASYGNEAEIGALLRDEASLKGNGAVPRERIFLTSKLRPQDAGYEKTLKAFNDTLTRLGADYLDLYLIHWPGTAKLPPTSAQHKINRLGSWKAMQASKNDEFCSKNEEFCIKTRNFVSKTRTFALTMMKYAGAAS